MRENNVEYPGNIFFSDLKKENLYLITNSENFANPLYIYFDPEKIKDYNDINEREKTAFLHVLANPKFCPKKGKSGVKTFSEAKSAFYCEVNDVSNSKFPIKHEIKIVGNSNEGRISLYEMNPIDSKGATLLVAGAYHTSGLHKKHEPGTLYTVKPILEKAQKMNEHGRFFRPHKGDVHHTDGCKPALSRRR